MKEITEEIAICSNQLFRQNHIYEVLLKLIALICLMSLTPKYFVVYSKEELKIENCIFRFAVVGIVNTEIFMSFIKLPFYKQTG